MRWLALDTASEYGSLALIEDGRIVEETPLHSPDGFGHVLFPQIQQLAGRHGWTLSELGGFAAGAGPGSFTGVRVALAAIKGLAEAGGAQAASVSNLQAVASFGSRPLRAAFYDARRGEIYAGLFNADLEPLEPERVLSLPAWLRDLPPEAELLTPDPAPFLAALAPRGVTRTPRALAAAIGRLAHGRWQDPAALDANYVRRSDAELHWREA